MLTRMSNEKYAGNLLLQKYHTVDFLTKKVEKNNGAVPQYYVENSHPPIVPYEVFLQAQGEMMRRGATYSSAFKAGEANSKKLSNKIFLSGRLICPQCGQPFWRKLEHGRHVWRCVNQNCKGHALGETVIQQAVVDAFNRLPEERGNLLLLRDQIERGLLAPIEAQLEAMEEDDPARAQFIMQRAEYGQMRLRIMSLLAWMEGAAEHRDYGPSCSDYDDFLERTHHFTSYFPRTEYDDALALRFLEKVNVHPDKLDVVFKAGVTVEVPLPAAHAHT